MADLDIPLLEPAAAVACSGCDWSGEWRHARLVIRNFSNLLDLSGRVPAGACPDCDALVFLANSGAEDLEHGLAYVARELLPLFFELEAGLRRLIDQGTLSESTVGADWVWLRAMVEKIQLAQHEALIAELRRGADH